MRYHGREVGCKLCGYSLESIPHWFLNCAHAINIWDGSLKIMVACDVNGSIVCESL